MKQIIVEGNNVLSGNILIGGAKNSAVALIPAAILSDDIVKIDNVPDISDIDALNEILRYLEAEVGETDGIMEINSKNIKNKPIPEEISKKLRASYYFMSALLGRFKKVEMYFPGGCSIGARPIDQTLKAYKAMGALVEEYGNKYIITADELIGSHVYLDMPSVGATVNTMLVAVKAKGTTIIENAAKEPEIVNIATFLNNMGAKITGAGTSEIVIKGVSYLGKAYIEVIPDRIEAGTYLIAGALIGNNLRICNVIPEHIDALTLKLKEMGFKLDIGVDYVGVSAKDRIKPVRVKTLGYPGFATDLQQPLTTLLTQCDGISILEETIYENRFKNIEFLNAMGANIEKIDNRNIKINGPSHLSGCVVEATDLRAGACLVLAALKANGVTYIKEIEHVLRGYENIVEKLRAVGAKIQIEDY
ncbi:MAG: UDP-N-acetylglucosamine 1-carboxyvinyltransferase [Bacilli bacterium]|nr:UDP-N-acetylglucosamine 1-carboxyvinyltransferase [Bacilli bacterium]